MRATWRACAAAGLALHLAGCASGGNGDPDAEVVDGSAVDGGASDGTVADAARDGASADAGADGGGGTCAGPPDCDLEPNNTPPAASPVPAQPLFELRAVGICSASDTDYYTLNLAGADHLNVRIDFTHTSGDLTLRLLDQAAAVVRNSDSSSAAQSFETFDLPSAAAGKYYIEVRGKDAAVRNPYSLTVMVNP